MTKSYAQMADEILNGALTDSTKNPYDPSTGHQAHMPTMDPNDKLIDMSDSQRHSLLKNVPGVQIQELTEQRVIEKPKQTPVVSPEEVDTLNEALRIIQKIQEATTVGNIGVNMAGGAKGEDPKKVKLPGDVNSAAPKKRVKKKTKPTGNDFVSYLRR